MKLEKIGSGRNHARWRQKAGLITIQEYVPFAAWLLAWAAITSAVGLSTTIYLMTAHGFTQAVRSLFSTQSFAAMSARFDCDAGLRARARKLALRVDFLVLFGCIALLFAMAAATSALGLPELAAMMLVLGIGLPARTPGILLAGRRNIGTPWQMGSTLILVAGTGFVAMFDLHWVYAALALGLRDWGGLIAVWLTRRPPAATISMAMPELAFPEIACRTSAAARRRLVYRIGKLAFSMFGPIGSVLARTGRGGGFDHRLARRLSVSTAQIGLLALASSAVVVGTIILSREPAALLIASVAARLAAASISVLIWWGWHEVSVEFEALEDELQ